MLKLVAEQPRALNNVDPGCEDVARIPWTFQSGARASYPSPIATESGEKAPPAAAVRRSKQKQGCDKSHKDELLAAAANGIEDEKARGDGGRAHQNTYHDWGAGGGSRATGSAECGELSYSAARHGRQRSPHGKVRPVFFTFYGLSVAC